MAVNRKFNANNELPLKNLHHERMMYELYSMEGIEKDRYLDLWGTKLLYGRINSSRDAVSLVRANVLSTVLQNEQVYVQALDFVADAFSDMKVDYERKSLKTGQLATLDATFGFEDPSVRYNRHFDNLVTIFLQNLYSSGDSSISDFDDFSSHFLDFLEKVSKVTPVTKSSYLKSSECSVMNSGLAIEISTLPHDDDSRKITNFVNDENFKLYSSALKQFGFVFDKNAPWRIIAEISSAKMQEYMEFYGVTYRPGYSSDLFEKYYIKCHNEDPFLLANALFSGYERLLIEKPQYRKSNFCKNMVNRKNLVRSEYDENYWIKFYLRTRLSESRKKIPKVRFDAILKKAKEKFFYVDLEEALRYINNNLPK